MSPGTLRADGRGVGLAWLQRSAPPIFRGDVETAGSAPTVFAAAPDGGADGAKGCPATSKVVLDVAMSLYVFTVGPDTVEANRLGKGGERLDDLDVDVRERAGRARSNIGFSPANATTGAAPAGQGRMAGLPPSTQIAWPVTHSPRSDRRKAAIAPMSAGSPWRNEGVVCQDFVPDLLWQVPLQLLGQHEAGRDAVGADPLLAILARDVPRQRADAGLGRLVGDVDRHAAVGGGGDRVHHRPAAGGDDLRDGVLAGQQVTRQVHVQRPPPRVKLDVDDVACPARPLLG